ncbi:hypothetical protein FACS1894153_1690 [Bacteroidia bacterium]|nr:hypothetical protein FACS1894153_1690 [Bacteroidia bacterium]
MEEITEVEYPRAFSPVDVKVDASSNSATVTWKVLDNAKTYFVELSSGDSLEFTNIIQQGETENLTYTFSGLQYDSLYNVRLRSAPATETQTESTWIGLSFKTRPTQYFITLDDKKVKADRVTLNWIPGIVATHISIDKGVGKINLTTEQIEAGELTVSGLESATAYKVTMYNGKRVCGELAFTSHWRPSGANVVQLPDGDGDALKAALEDEENAGKIIYLPSGTYNVSSEIAMSSGMTIWGDQEAEPKVKIEYTSTSRLIKLVGTAIDTLKFIHLEIACTDGNATTQGTYFINQGSNEAMTVNALILEDCYVHEFGRSLIRYQGVSQIINNLIVENCILERIGVQPGQSYSILQTNVSATPLPKFDNVVFNNTTVFNCANSTAQHVFRIEVAGVLGKMDISNCTFYDVGGGDATFFMNFNNGTATGSIKNSIFSKTAAGTGVAGIRGFRGIELSNAVTSYKTSDWLEKFEGLPGLESYAGDSDALFTNPSAGNFKIKDGSAPAGLKNSGDPRWK